jgi:coenzyme F420-dependent glucose-6-phosphate dehydrogenase
MVTVGYHASHEQHAPSRLRSHLVAAEQAGFTARMCSDHFHPWSEQQGQSGFAWSWLGAALEATQLAMGVVNAPGQRYHPAIIAQAAATLAEMYPERFWLAVGSGQDLNEHITGEAWPRKADRDQRLLESVEVIRALWRGETVTHRGAVVVEDAHLYTRPERPPRLLGAALTPRTASGSGAGPTGWSRSPSRTRSCARSSRRSVPAAARTSPWPAAGFVEPLDGRGPRSQVVDRRHGFAPRRSDTSMPR